MNPRIHVTQFFSTRQKLGIQRKADGSMVVTDWTGTARVVGEEEANAIALAVLDGSGVAELSRSEAV